MWCIWYIEMYIVDVIMWYVKSWCRYWYVYSWCDNVDVERWNVYILWFDIKKGVCIEFGVERWYYIVKVICNIDM